MSSDFSSLPHPDEFELTVFGPGYGECVVVHVGGGSWVVVDSCMDGEGRVSALSYFRDIGVDFSSDVALVVATHWHDDHVRGISQLVESCPNAVFSCASILCDEEFFAITDALGQRNLSVSGSGTRELHRVFEALAARPGRSGRVVYAFAGRSILNRQNCKVLALSPFDPQFTQFLLRLREMVPGPEQPGGSSYSFRPNDVAVALRIEAGGVVALLGADLEKKGWIAIAESGGIGTPLIRKASAFKIPHHGSESADDPVIWSDLLEADPFAVVSPWKRGRGILPTEGDVTRMSQSTPNAYITSCREASARDEGVKRFLRNSRIRLGSIASSDPSAVRFRRGIGSGSPWRVELFGSAHRL